CQRYGYSTWTF
nr:immunoglobulin light chain junction region [Macaca mulatta]MOV80605.1 immunoglobulin light chain junction region [Macaca mulatta]